jgi:hypothetical protein
MDDIINDNITLNAVEQNPLHQSLQELIGLHRQLLEVVKLENEALVQADSKALFDVTASKEALIHWISQAEQYRQSIVYKMSESNEISKPGESLRAIILSYQSKNPEISKQLQTDLNALLVLVERIKTQNGYNEKLIGHSIKHVDAMRKNIFGEAQVESKTYNKAGQKNQPQAGSSGPRIISKEV